MLIITVCEETQLVPRWQNRAFVKAAKATALLLDIELSCTVRSRWLKSIVMMNAVGYEKRLNNFSMWVSLYDKPADTT